MTDEFNEVDMDALRRAMVRAMTSTDPGRREQIESMLLDRPWVEVAEYAAYGAQMRSLQLKPWQNPPAHGGVDPESNALLDRMLKAGISQFEPDPLAALAEAEQKAR
jgi:hypothetical protein